jgi:4-carboxymuconolactone decarboxylase
VGRIPPPEPLPELVALTAPPGGRPPITITALAHCEPLLGPFLGWAAALALNGMLPKRDHEILALRAAHNCRSGFEWDEHSVFARTAGLTQHEIGCIASGDDPGWTRREQLLLAAADELHRDTTISADTWRELTAVAGTDELVEAIYVVGQYTMLSMVANVVEGEAEM